MHKESEHITYFHSVYRACQSVSLYCCLGVTLLVLGFFISLWPPFQWTKMFGIAGMSLCYMSGMLLFFTGECRDKLFVYNVCPGCIDALEETVFVLQRCNTRSVLSLAFDESPTILGVVLEILTDCTQQVFLVGLAYCVLLFATSCICLGPFSCLCI